MMNRMKLGLALLMAVTLVFGAYAQSRVTLTVVASEGPAQVILNGKLLGMGNPTFRAPVAPGTYELIVRKAGLPEFKQRITIGAGGLTVNAQLGSASAPQQLPPPTVMSYQLTVNSNVNGADVFINGAQAGKTPYNGQVAAGTYTIVVRAAGYSEFSQGVSVNQASTVVANLAPLAVPLNLGRLFPGAEVFLNGAKIGVAGSNPFVAQVAPGTYTLTIRAGGFMDLSMQITVGAGGFSTTPVLQPLMADFQFQLPLSMTNPDMKGNPWSQIRVYVDGAPQKDFKGQVTPGRHVLKMVSGAFQIEFPFDFEAGKSYVIEPFAGMTVR
jgi:hypothetical protein